MSIKLTDKNGKPLYGAAKQAVLNKQLAWQNDEIDLFFTSTRDRIERLERQIKYWPLTVIAALFFGCVVGKIIQPDLAVIAVGCAGAGAGAMLAIERHK
ncbi:hypothetical protein QUA71_06925 [Microcoleus sp. MON1_C5]|uniref:hypothetical protein n=1 Tax=Microcoleus sp. MON1_C5 TaxID=2818828 RepID=UPI002FCF53C7